MNFRFVIIKIVEILILNPFKITLAIVFGQFSFVPNWQTIICIIVGRAMSEFYNIFFPSGILKCFSPVGETYNWFLLKILTQNSRTFYSLMKTFYSMMKTFYSMMKTFYSMMKTFYSMMKTFYSMIKRFYSMMKTFYVCLEHFMYV
jgi:hypothetical protein